MKKFLKTSIIIFIALSLSIIAIMKLYIPTGSIILKTHGRIGNQLFQYAAAYSLAKETNSKLFVIVDPKKERDGYEKSEYSLGEFNIPKENIIYLNKLNRLYFKLIYGYYNSSIAKRIKKILQIKYINEMNYFEYNKSKNNKLIIMHAYFESPIYFDKYKKELLKIYEPKNIDHNKLNDIINNISKKDSVCIHVRRGDMVQLDRFTTIDFQKEAIDLTKELISNPKFFIFSDDPEMVRNELSDVTNLEFIEDNLAMEDLYLMSNCGNNIITRSSFSWWAAYLNQNNGFVISPYNLYSEKYYMGLKDLKERAVKRDLYAKATPHNWILLNEANKYTANAEVTNFNIYAGNRRRLRICENGNFRPHLCYFPIKCNFPIR